MLFVDLRLGRPSWASFLPVFSQKAVLCLLFIPTRGLTPTLPFILEEKVHPELNILNL